MSLDDPNVPQSAGAPAATPAVLETPKPTPPTPATPAVAPIPPQIQDFDALIKGDVQNFVNLGEKIGGLVAEQVCARYRSFWMFLTVMLVQSSSASLPG